jgi:cytochrome bd-type quinol oxidase subunit 2
MLRWPLAGWSINPFPRVPAGNLGMIIVSFIILSRSVEQRTRALWWVLATLVLTSVGAFWAVYPVLGMGVPPNATALHATKTGLALAGLLTGRSAYDR